MDDHGSLDLFKAVDRDRLENLRIDLDRPLKIEDVVLIQYWKPLRILAFNMGFSRSMHASIEIDPSEFLKMTPRSISIRYPVA